MVNKQTIGHFLRQAGLYKPLDFIRYLIFKIIKYPENKKFIKNNPEIILPPDYLMYESFQLDYTKYYNHSVLSARDLINVLCKHVVFENINILDWGCGPARIIRHFPELLSGKNCHFYATDYNAGTIEWCKKNIKGIDFRFNNISPPLDFPNEMFDVVYGISIFTHLSEKMHYEWLDELLRVTKKGGVIYLTLHGDAFRKKLISNELARYNRGELVVRGNVKEGHRTYVAFHPEKFVNNFFKDNTILEFIQGSGSARPQQDIWIIRKS